MRVSVDMETKALLWACLEARRKGKPDLASEAVLSDWADEAGLLGLGSGLRSQEAAATVLRQLWHLTTGELIPLTLPDPKEWESHTFPCLSGAGSWSCTRARGHGGEHRAWGSKHCCAVWEGEVVEASRT